MLLSAAWWAALVGLYLPLLWLDVAWNLARWHPQLNGDTVAALVWIMLVLVALWFLALAIQDRFSRSLSLTGCLAFLVVAAHALPAEPLTTGLFAREVPSPLWYRLGRFAIMAVPMLFWVRGSRPARTCP